MAEQPMPTPSDRPAIQDLVAADVAERKALGISRYGTPLQGFNGRDALRDLYEELLDACQYTRQLIWERDAERPAPGSLLTPEQSRVQDRNDETATGWPTSASMVDQLREVLGLFVGAMPVPPRRVWEETLDEVRRLRERAGG